MAPRQALAASLALALALAASGQPPSDVAPGPPAPVQLPNVAAALVGPAAAVPVEALGPAAATLSEVQLGACQLGAPPLPLVELTIAAARRALLSGALNCSQLVAAYAQRVLALDARLSLNAVRALHPGAAAAAAAADAALEAARGNATAAAALPPLLCVPVLVKDNFDVQGLATTAGVCVCGWLGG